MSALWEVRRECDDDIGEAARVVDFGTLIVPVCTCDGPEATERILARLNATVTG